MGTEAEYRQARVGAFKAAGCEQNPGQLRAKWFKVIFYVE